MALVALQNQPTEGPPETSRQVGGTPMYKPVQRGPQALWLPNSWELQWFPFKPQLPSNNFADYQTGKVGI